MRFPLAYDTTTTRADFVRLLQQATGGLPFQENDDGFFHGQEWSVRLTPIPSLEIGMVRLERHRVEIAFSGLTAKEQDDFMQRFTLHYQRGGG